MKHFAHLQRKHRNFAKLNSPSPGNRLLISLLCLSLILPQLAGIYLGASAEEVCKHHLEHTPACGYIESVEGSPCTHICDASCSEATESKELDCGHIHDDACGYRAEPAVIVPCDHVCDENCLTESGECGHACGDGTCSYQEEPQEISPCTHEHGEECFTTFWQSVCTHEHGEECGYIEPVEGAPCQFVCPICTDTENQIAVQALDDTVLAEHIVGDTKPGTVVDPPNSVINLFDYTVDEDGALGNDLLKGTDWHANAAGTQSIRRNGPESWNKGINENKLLLFGDGIIHAGFWNKGAGSGSKYGSGQTAGMSNIVENVLVNDYPVINTGDPDKKTGMYGQLSNFEGISDWQLCGDPLEGEKLNVQWPTNAHNSIKPQNISNSVIQNWQNNDGDPSLSYLFDLTESDYKKVYPDISGLFQMDNEGYYTYNMRENFAELDQENSKFILYDNGAVVRTDPLNGESVSGNFFPFNTGAQVFDQVTEDGRLSNSLAIQSSNGANTSGNLMNHHLGMTMEVNFRQPISGAINMGADGNQNMSFQFAGDDDVWIFIDDVLVLDLGGIHSEVYGIIDFANGNVFMGQAHGTADADPGIPEYRPNASGNTADNDYGLTLVKRKTTIRDAFRAAGKENDMTWKGNTFASNTNHTLRMFYLERGNYDSSLALRFNLAPRLFQRIKKVDQFGEPLQDVEFNLYPAQLASEGEEGAILCTNSQNPADRYVKLSGTKDESNVLTKLKTKEDGTAEFTEKDTSGKDLDTLNPFNFADRYDPDTGQGQYYILSETSTPPGYRSLPMDIVLEYDPDTFMVTVANRWTTGAYASFTSTITGAGEVTYGHYNEDTGTVDEDLTKILSQDVQKSGLAVAIPMLQSNTDSTVWNPLYGSNVFGFRTVDYSDRNGIDLWRRAALMAVLYQCADKKFPSWHLEWDEELDRMVGEISDLPGRADRYSLINKVDPDLRMEYAFITADALKAIGITDCETLTMTGRYQAIENILAARIPDILDQENVDRVVSELADTILSVQDPTTGSGYGFSFLSVRQFSRNFRSLIYISNEQRQLRVQKVDQDGVARNGAEFTLFNANGDAVAQGVTDTVDGQKGMLVFQPRPPKNEAGEFLPGYSEMIWSDLEDTFYYLQETRPAPGCGTNTTRIPVVVGTYSIYADAGTAGDGVTVMAGVGKLAQTMVQYATDGEVNVTLRDITAVGQTQSSGEFDLDGWSDMTLAGTQHQRSMNLHYGKNAVIDYGLHDEDGGKNLQPFFVTDTGFIRARVKQNSAALTTEQYPGEKTSADFSILDDTPITSLFSLLNIVVVTDKTIDDTETGNLTISKTVTEEPLTEEDCFKNFQFTILFTDKNGVPLPGEFHFYGTDKSGTIRSGETLPLHHDESITVLGLPAGTKFTVTEAEETGWYVLPDTGIITGEIEKDQTVTASFANRKTPWPRVGALTLRKTVLDGDEADAEKEFGFIVTLMDETDGELEGEFPYSGSKDGTMHSGDVILLRGGESVTIWNLPENTVYQVTERTEDQDGYYTTVSDGGEGTISNGKTSEAHIVNQKGVGALTLRKTIEDAEADDMDTEFEFTVTLKDEAGKELKGEFPYTGSKEGVLHSGDTVSLKHGESITINGLPGKAHYEITEKETEGYGAPTVSNGGKGTITADETADVHVVNHKNLPGTGMLTLRKTIENAEAADTDTEFEFTVILKDAANKELPGEFPYSGSKEGVLRSGDTVLLKHDESVTIHDLPEDAVYQVTEKQAAGYDNPTISGNDSGSIVADENAEVHFINHKNRKGVGTLTLRKTVEAAEAADTDTEFEFTVILKDEANKELPGEFAYTGSKTGVLHSGGTILLKHGESVTIHNLPEDTVYQVTEKPAAGYGNPTVSGNGRGSITADENAEVHFINHKERRPHTDPGTGTLTLRKTVEAAEAADTDTEFEFTVILKDEANKELPGEFAYTGSKTGVLHSGGTILLKHGESITIHDLPENTSYQVTEKKTAGYGDPTVPNDGQGTIQSGTDSEIHFINHKSATQTPTPSPSPNPSPKPRPSQTPPPSGQKTPTGGSKLPQTGINWWPVWISSGAGVTLVTAGCTRRKRYKPRRFKTKHEK